MIAYAAIAAAAALAIAAAVIGSAWALGVLDRDAIAVAARAGLLWGALWPITGAALLYRWVRG